MRIYTIEVETIDHEIFVYDIEAETDENALEQANDFYLEEYPDGEILDIYIQAWCEA